MILYNTDIMPDTSEIVHYDDSELKLYIRRGRLSLYTNYRAAAHWHEDLEFIRIFSGEMQYSINGQIILLKQDDILFVNASQMHFGFSDAHKECDFLCVLVHPSLLASNSGLLKENLAPMLRDETFPYYHLTAGEMHRDADKENLLKLLDGVYDVKSRFSDTYGYRFCAVGMLQILIGQILDVWMRERSSRGFAVTHGDAQIDLVRSMVTFIENNYTSDLSLDEIAASASVSRSTCCRLFKKYVSTTPLAFLNSYRIQEAASLLRSTDRTITHIASACGFSHASYFTSLFQKMYGCTPRDFRASGVSGQQPKLICQDGKV